MKTLLVIGFLIFIVSCKTQLTENDEAKIKQEILNTENDFELAVKEKGIGQAFYEYAAEDACLNRNDSLIKGKENIKLFYETKKDEKIQLTWKADFVEVSTSGDLAYSYGKYLYIITDTTSKTAYYKGIFHTVWKKQKDGKWKYVWD